ncbi:NAD(P)H-binding protein [Microbispora sp. NBC_01189]|uniref:NAD(P)H-binding protein n=1 Tax=Microbispora sp. NBC_01189 TaxID=2903583 RepID=UPI002E0EBB49|nr:NAD(P)H-binding protein [Microbispora sp. NBC_01189]
MIVVTGATGNVGRVLVRLLAEAGEEVTAVARRVSAADVPEGVRTVAADLADPAGLRPALEGADALFLVTPGDYLAMGGNVRPILRVAAEAGVRRVVLLSSQSAGTRPLSPGHGLRALEDESEVRNSGLEWTILRPGGFASNAFAWAESVRLRRTVTAPFGDVGLPVVDPGDIAEVAAAALREPGHDGRVYELTGPERVSPRQIAAALGDALGEPVRFAEQSRDEARALMAAFMPEEVADGTLAILGEPTPGERRVSPEVERVLGRAPRPFSDWARRNAAAFR